MFESEQPKEFKPSVSLTEKTLRWQHRMSDRIRYTAASVVGAVTLAVPMGIVTKESYMVAGAAVIGGGTAAVLRGLLDVNKETKLRIQELEEMRDASRQNNNE